MGVQEVLEMTPEEIKKRLFDGVRPDQAVSLFDKFTVPEIVAMSYHEDLHKFPHALRALLVSAIRRIGDC